MDITSRTSFTTVEGASDIFTPRFVEYLESGHDRFTSRILELRRKRSVVLHKALEQRYLPTYLPLSKINTTEWRIPDIPADLKRPGIEITGPASVTSMFINALNPGVEGIRAEGDLDDDEDSAGHRFIDTVMATRNRLAAVERSLNFTNQETGRHYKIEDGDLPFFMHRERGLHLDEPEVTIDEGPVPAAILGTSLTLFHAGRAQIERKQGVYFYLPKLESAEEARFWRDFFDFSIEHLDLPKTSIIRAIPLVESLPMAYQMEEALYALGPYAAGLNAARWDLKASIFEFIMADPDSIWPDRFEIDIKTTEFLANICRRLVAICLKRGAIPIGGMATALPSRETEINEAASAAIKADKEWEAQQGFLRGWVAHIFHMKTAADPFKDLRFTGWKPTPEMAKPENFPIKIGVPEGPITVNGTRRNARMLIEYIEGWLTGRGAKGIDSLEGRPGIHPPLMEDLATGRISVAQIAQRIRHCAKDTKTGQIHDFALVKRLLNEEVNDIVTRRRSATPTEGKALQLFTQSEERYKKSVKIAMQWSKNYTELDFRSLGSYTRSDLEAIAAGPDAF